MRSSLIQWVRSGLILFVGVQLAACVSSNGVRPTEVAPAQNAVLAPGAALSVIPGKRGGIPFRGSSYPVLLTGTKGQLALVWAEQSNAGDDSLYRSVQIGNTWSKIDQIGQATEGSIHALDSLRTPKGSFVWWAEEGPYQRSKDSEESSGFRTYKWHSLFWDGETWSQNFSMEGIGMAFWGVMNVTQTTQGDVVALWYQNTKMSPEGEARVYGATWQWAEKKWSASQHVGPVWSLDSASLTQIEQLKLLPQSDGTIVAVWPQPVGKSQPSDQSDPVHLYGAVWKQGKWQLPAVQLSGTTERNDSFGDLEISQTVNIAKLPNNQVAVVWIEPERGHFARIYNGKEWGPLKAFERMKTNSLPHVQISDGKLLVSWFSKSRNGNSKPQMKSECWNGRTWIALPPLRTNDYANIKMSANGTLWASWHEEIRKQTVWYTAHTQTGTWSKPEMLPTNLTKDPMMSIHWLHSPGESIYALIETESYDVFLAKKELNGWGTLVPVGPHGLHKDSGGGQINPMRTFLNDGVETWVWYGKKKTHRNGSGALFFVKWTGTDWKPVEVPLAEDAGDLDTVASPFSKDALLKFSYSDYSTQRYVSGDAGYLWDGNQATRLFQTPTDFHLYQEATFLSSGLILQTFRTKDSVGLIRIQHSMNPNTALAKR